MKQEKQNVITRPIRLMVASKHEEVSGLMVMPESAEYLYLFAHGAGAGMDHYFMEKVAGCLADERIGSLRFNFPYTEKNNKRPDHESVLTATIQAAYDTAQQHANNLPLMAGGKSMGGRMTSIAASKELLKEIRGIVFFGFPLHAPGQPTNHRAEHLYRIKTPMLFLQGTRDKLADMTLLNPVITKLGNKASLHTVENADHSFKLPKSAGKNEDEVFIELAAKVKAWADGIR